MKIGCLTQHNDALWMQFAHLVEIIPNLIDLSPGVLQAVPSIELVAVVDDSARMKLQTDEMSLSVLLRCLRQIRPCHCKQ